MRPVVQETGQQLALATLVGQEKRVRSPEVKHLVKRLNPQIGPYLNDAGTFAAVSGI